MDVPHSVLAGVRRRQSKVVQGCLWALLAVIGVVVLLNLAIEGPTVGSLAPNLAFAAIVGFALWLNGRERFEQALGLISAVVLASVAVTVTAGGLGGSGVALVLLFVPVVLVGLLLGRGPLYLTGSAALAIVVLPAALRQANVLPRGTLGSEERWLVALQYAIVLAIVMFLLDRFNTALRDALTGSVEREVALEEEMGERKRAEDALLDEKVFSDAVVGNLPDLFFVATSEGRFVQWNAAFGAALGRGDAEIRHLSLQDVFDRGGGDGSERTLAEVLERGSANAEATVDAKDGRAIPVFLTISRASMSDADYLVGIAIDTSELTAARTRIEGLNEELRMRLDHLTALREIDRAITGSLDLDLTLRVILDQVTRQLDVDAASVLLYKERRQSLRFGGAKGFRTDALRTTDLRLGEGQAGRAAMRRERVMITGSAEFADAFQHAEKVAAEGFQVYIAAPLVAKGQLHGVLELFHRSPLTPTEDWYAFLDTLLTQIAIALDSATMFENMERSNADLRLAYDTTIEGWARALDLRDEETVGHSRRVTETTLRLAEAMGVSEEALVHVRRGALLHDIGKMGVPDDVLLKPGRLDEEEWETMKRHTTYAFELLSPIAFLKPALDIPYAHHERWDGTGYPRGLKGEQIPFAARIFAVADVYDALTSDRPYRSAWTSERALAHIRDEAGTHFEPAVVEAFLELMEARDGAGPPSSAFPSGSWPD